LIDRPVDDLYAVIAVSWVVVAAGGALGAFVGIMASFASARVLRSDRSPPLRLGLAATLSFGSVVGFLILAGLVGILIQQFAR
jgi:hypothetical protein